MIYWTIKWIFISFILIFLIHYLYSFLKTMLTVPKVRDLVNKPVFRYDEIISTKNATKNVAEITTQDDVNIENPINNDNMQNELANFLLDLKKPNIPNQSSDLHNIIPANSEGNKSDSFSTY